MWINIFLTVELNVLVRQLVILSEGWKKLQIWLNLVGKVKPKKT